MKKTGVALALILVTTAPVSVFAQTETNPNLSKDQIAQVQQALKAQGYDPGTTDGTWDPGSQKAIGDFQANRALPNSHGQIDENTLHALNVKIAQ